MSFFAKYMTITTVYDIAVAIMTFLIAKTDINERLWWLIYFIFIVSSNILWYWLIGKIDDGHRH